MPAFSNVKHSSSTALPATFYHAGELAEVHVYYTSTYCSVHVGFNIPLFNSDKDWGWPGCHSCQGRTQTYERGVFKLESEILLINIHDIHTSIHRLHRRHVEY